MSNTEMTGAQALVRSLSKLGVTTVYGVPGEETTDLMAAIYESDLEFILCRHEQSAAFMASVYGRLMHKPAACLATLGPGATNLVTGVADAELDHVPLIALTGQGERGRLGRESHQIIDLESLFAPITKFSRHILDVDDIPASAAEAYRLAISEKPGAVHLSLPVDVAKATTSSAFVPVANPVYGTPDDTTLSEAAARLLESERPVIVAGNGVHRANASSALRAFAEATHVPIATTFMGKGVLPVDHPQTLFTVGQPEKDHIDNALEAADLIVAIGFDPIEYPSLELTKGGETPVISIDTLASPVDSGWTVQVQVIGDITAAIEGIQHKLECAVWPENTDFAKTRSSMREAFESGGTETKDGTLIPADICAEITRQLRNEDTVLSGVGLHKLWIARNVHASRPGQVIIPNGLAGMGLALPGAIAAAQIKNSGRVLAVCGDGDMLMNLQEMETASRLGLRLTVMVWEDGGYGLIDEHQEDGGPQYSFNSPNWSDLAHAFGWVHAPVETMAELSEVLTAAHDAEGPTLVTLKVDYAAAGGMPHMTEAA
ncbi:acetolactate synthase large subunit [Marivita hallyeonensis]|uniref:Acetolactate synthase-1/2/3 large subunit n=1 Tax=Marivita hallyeonensis TaxID=996342 RepID=A0A1M5MQQ7_9RHOB|nr:acetolactate synthase large subunit [Marivita hallyeonensis]SHG79113.1 acetolactate synthase-1/2/3 large subunit [Marivita hallyeonensis]